MAASTVVALMCWAAPVHAQTQDQTQTPAASLFNAPLPSPNGFDDLFDAVEKLLRIDRLAPPFPTGAPVSAAPEMTDAELLLRKRDTVSRNKRALAALRLALEKPIIHPPVRNAAGDFGSYRGFRALGALLDQESAVRAAGRDYSGAMQSKLDAIELGVVITRGAPLRATFAGRDIEGVGRRGIETLVPELTDKERTAAAARLERIETLRPPFADAIREGKIASLAITRDVFDNQNWEEVVMGTAKLNGAPFSPDELGALSTIGQAEVLAGIDRTFNAVLPAADAPYQPAPRRADSALDPWSNMLVGAVNLPFYRAEYEAARAQNLLLSLALKLRVSRTRNGSYPETLETPRDPFAGDPFADADNANNTLKYRRNGDGYLLYSVGPNAKDDGGAPLQRDSKGALPTGDLVAPVFPL